MEAAVAGREEVRRKEPAILRFVTDGVDAYASRCLGPRHAAIQRDLRKDVEETGRAEVSIRGLPNAVLAERLFGRAFADHHRAARAAAAAAGRNRAGEREDRRVERERRGTAGALARDLDLARGGSAEGRECRAAVHGNVAIDLTHARPDDGRTESRQGLSAILPLHELPHFQTHHGAARGDVRGGPVAEPARGLQWLEKISRCENFRHGLAKAATRGRGSLRHPGIAVIEAQLCEDIEEAVDAAASVGEQGGCAAAGGGARGAFTDHHAWRECRAGDGKREHLRVVATRASARWREPQLAGACT